MLKQQAVVVGLDALKQQVVVVGLDTHEATSSCCSCCGRVGC